MRSANMLFGALSVERPVMEDCTLESQPNEALLPASLVRTLTTQ